MQKFLFTIILVLAGLTGQAHAGIVGNERIELRPPSVTIDQIAPAKLETIDYAQLKAPIQHVPSHVFPAFTPYEDEARGPLEFHLPEMGPETLDLEYRSGAFLFKVGAEMVDGRAKIVWSPRLDCESNETYFWVRASYDLDEHWTVFCESFQAAGSILGWDTQSAHQGYVWDGFQIQPGVHYQVNDQLGIEGGPVLYTMSATKKPNELGARIGLRFEF